MQDTFRSIYRSGIWGGTESASGWGSDLESTRVVRSLLPELLTSLGVSTLLDAPCGDLHWMREVDLGGVEYVGVDVVPEVVEENRSLYGAPDRRFLVADLTRSRLPAADLVLCRDCLVHLSHADSRAAIRNLKACAPRGAHLLTTTFPAAEENQDIVTGDWRPLNLELEPFNFSPPLRLVSEECPSDDPISRSKSLALWRLDDLT